MRLALGCLLLASASPSVVSAQLSPIRDRAIEPERWAESRGPECESPERADGTLDREICDGPRRVPLSVGPAAERAARLGLGPRRSADQLRLGEPFEAWLREIPSEPRQDLLWPVPWGLFSRGVGYVRREELRHRPHNGVDIVARAGAHIRAANDGLVVYADNGVTGFGNLLVLLHADGTATLYGHCQAIYVAPGELVVRGQAVAEVGNTGRPYRPHLHFEWRRDGDALDPMPRFVERPRASEVRPDGGDQDAPPPPNALRIEASEPVSEPVVLARSGGT